MKFREGEFVSPCKHVLKGFHPLWDDEEYRVLYDCEDGDTLYLSVKGYQVGYSTIEYEFIVAD